MVYMVYRVLRVYRVYMVYKIYRIYRFGVTSIAIITATITAFRQVSFFLLPSASCRRISRRVVVVSCTAHDCILLKLECVVVPVCAILIRFSSL